ncbi:MAG: SDR family NAD(P)-dependent oxidoreductase [Pseudomonadota bacterium]
MSRPKTVLVVGASSGIGEAIAKRLIAKSHVVYGTSRDATRVSVDGVIPLSLDVFKNGSIAQAIETIVEQQGRLDALIYSAGFYITGAVEDTEMDRLREQMHAYFFAAVECARHALPHMRAQKSGRLVFMSSTAGTVAIPFHAAYSASKGALGRWTEALQYELEPFGINASYIEAGPIQTNAGQAMKAAQNDKSAYFERAANAETSFKDSLSKGLPPDRIARVVSDAIDRRRPKVRYRVGGAGAWFPRLQAMLPETIFRTLMQSAFKI